MDVNSFRFLAYLQSITLIDQRLEVWHRHQYFHSQKGMEHFLNDQDEHE